MFSLIDEPWIEVVDSAGEQKLVGLKHIFNGEADAIEVRGDSPLQDYAITRLLLAIFWRAHTPDTKVRAGRTFNFADWFQRTRRTLASRGRDDTAVDYLETYRHRFELLDSDTPFMQVAGLHTAAHEVKSVSTLIPEIHDEYFTMRAGDALERLTFAEASRWLVYTQAYDFSGIKSGMVGDPRVKGGKGYPIGTGWSGMTGGTLVVGSTLLETLILNTTRESITTPSDKPAWERTPDSPDARSSVGENTEPQGSADLATWQSRRIALHANDHSVTGVVVGNGDRIPDAGANVLHDPMTPYRYSANKSKKNLDVYYPRPYDVERTVWKALDALIVTGSDSGFNAKNKAPLRPRTLSSLAALAEEIEGIPSALKVKLVSAEYGPQASSVATTFSAEISLPIILLMERSTVLRQQVRDAAEATSQAAVHLGRFAGNLLVAAGGEYQFNASATDRVLAELEPDFNAWLEKLSDIPDEQLDPDNAVLSDLVVHWQTTARSRIDAHARILLRGAGPRALAGRILPPLSEGGRERFVSAASYYQSLQRSLSETLPATANDGH